MHHPLDSLLAFMAGVLVATTVQLMPDTINLTTVGAFAAIGGAVGTTIDVWQRNSGTPYGRVGLVVGAAIGLVIFISYAAFGG
jgi:hypothetical protein